MEMKNPKFKDLIICDDIRQEVGNKVSFMGIYQNVIFIPHKDFVFSKLCFVITLEGGNGVFNFIMKIIQPNNKALSTLKIQEVELKSGRNIKFMTVNQNLRIPLEGPYRLAIFDQNNKEKPLCDIKFEIKIIPSNK